MSLDTISTRANDQTIDQTWFNILQAAIGTDFVPRSASGVPTDVAGGLGSATYRWLSLYAASLNFGASGLLITFASPVLSSGYTLTWPTAIPSTSEKKQLHADSAGALTFEQAIPAGCIFPSARVTVPTGYLLCDGSAISRTTYSALFTAIGTAHGTGDGSTTFNIPDYRGRFLRGAAHAQATDPDRAARTAMATGGATGDNIGTVQADGFASHTHGWSAGNGGVGADSTAVQDTNKITIYNAATQGTGGNETRPKNAYVDYIIKT